MSRAVLKPFVAVFSLLAAAVYLAWRVVDTSAGANPILFVLLLLADLVVIGVHVLQMAPFVRFQARPDEVVSGTAPNVDVVLIVGDEPLIQIRIALRAALELRGGVSVSLLNTFARADVAAACRRLGVRHMGGSGPESTGRLTSELIARTRADFCVVLPGAIWVDPDLGILVQPSFEDPKVAVVSQPAVVTGNAGLVGGDGYRATPDADAAYGSHLDANGAAPAMEGPVVFRRAALRELKGFAVGSSRFTLHTQLALAAEGWTSRFVRAPGAYRPADWDEDQALRGRASLMSGRLSVARQPNMGWRPTGVRGWAQMPHVLALLELWSVVARVVVFAMVPVVALTGRLPLTSSLRSAAIFAGVWFISRGLARRFLLNVERPPAADVRRGARLMASDIQTIRDGGKDGTQAGRAGRAASAQAWATLALLTAAAIGAFTQALGRGMQPLPDLAHATLICASVAMVWLARDSSWAVADRQHRVLPRAGFKAKERGEVLEVSPFGVDVVGHYLLGAEMIMPVRLPLPGGRRWEATLTAVVRRSGMLDGVELSYLQFDLDDRTLDELGYYCAVTAPTLDRLGHAVRPFGFPEPTGRARSTSEASPNSITYIPTAVR